MRSLWLCAFIGLMAAIPFSGARAIEDDDPWSATLYAGPSSNKFLTQIYRDGQLNPDGDMIGLALDRRLVTLGWGFTLEGEGQVLQSSAHGLSYTTFALGLGLRFHNFPWSNRVPTSFAIYNGPSYATSPPASGIGFNDQPVTFAKVKYLHYFALELAVAIPDTDKWDGVLRVFHRSGMFGVYSKADDTMHRNWAWACARDSESADIGSAMSKRLKDFRLTPRSLRYPSYTDAFGPGHAFDLGCRETRSQS